MATRKKGRLLSLATPEKRVEQLNRALDMLASFKAREGRIVRGLGAVLLAIRQDDMSRASLAIDSLMTTDLKEAKQYTYDRDAALKIAVAGVKSLIDERAPHGYGCKCADCGQDGRNTRGIRVLNQIKQIAPEAFEEVPALAGAAHA